MYVRLSPDTLFLILLLMSFLSGCTAAREQSESNEAAQYKIQQHFSAECAESGLLPGTAPFNDCVAKLEAAPSVAPAPDVMKIAP